MDAERKIHRPDLFPVERVETGYVVCFEGVGFWSRIISLRTSSRVTHVGVALVNHVFNDRQVMLVEAKEGRGVRWIELGDYLGQWRRVDVYRPNVDQIPHEALTWLVSQSKQGYAPWWQFVWSWGLLSRWFRKRFGLKLDITPNSTMCSGLAAEFLVRCGLKLTLADGLEYEPEEITPGDIPDLKLVHLGRLK